MNRYLSFSCVLIILAGIISCQRESKISKEKNTIPLGIIDSLHSDILKENRKIWVYTPGDTTKKYPLLILLDGDAHYFSLAGMIHQLSSINDNTICPEMVVVGIPNTDRTRDLTPYHIKSFFGDSISARTSGGADNFAKFIGEELLPYIEKEYPVTKYRTIVGHSFGGLFVVNTLMHHPDLFTNYLAIDPSLWWDKQKFGIDAANALRQAKLENKSLYVAVANTMPAGKQLKDMEGDTASSTMHIRSILKFNEEMSGAKNGLNFTSKYYPDDDHGSVPLIAEYEAIRQFFSWYRLTGINDFFDPSAKNTAADFLKRINDHYLNVSNHLGYEVLPPEGNMNNMGYYFMNQGMNEKALACFELNVKNYPKHANVFDSLGDYYVSQKDSANAITSYEKALEINNKADHTKEKLSAMKTKVK